MFFYSRSALIVDSLLISTWELVHLKTDHHKISLFLKKEKKWKPLCRIIPDHRQIRWHYIPQSSPQWACRRRPGRCCAALTRCQTQSHTWRLCPFLRGLVVLQVWPACTHDSLRSSPWPSEDESWGHRRKGETQSTTIVPVTTHRCTASREPIVCGL